MQADPGERRASLTLQRAGTKPRWCGTFQVVSSSLTETQFPISPLQASIFSAYLDLQWSNNRSSRHEACCGFYFILKNDRVGSIWDWCWGCYYHLHPYSKSGQISGTSLKAGSHSKHLSAAVTCSPCDSGCLLILWAVCVGARAGAWMWSSSLPSAAASHELYSPPDVDYFHFLSDLGSIVRSHVPSLMLLPPPVWLSVNEFMCPVGQ